MAFVTRNQVLLALYSLLDASANRVAKLGTSALRLRNLDGLDPAAFPALFLVQGLEHYERTEGNPGLIGLPPRRTIHFNAFLYTLDPQEESVVAITQINDLTDAIEQALAPDATTGRQTLGGLVASARIDGTIAVVENLENSGKSAAMIPIAVIRP
jgi:hypothetical protein